LPTGKIVCEIGAGSGATAIKLSQMGAKVYCIDYSQKSIELIKKNAAQCGATVFCIKADAFALPFKTGVFDICYHQGFLEHFRDISILLSEPNRILKQNGYLLVDVPQKYSLYTVKKKLLIFLGKWFAGWETEFSINRLKKVLGNAGFSPEKSFGRYHIRNIDKIQKHFLGRTYLPVSLEKLYSRIINVLENSWFGVYTAFTIGVLARKQ
jgi:ubiquinone/menaquinone biosynthesis C-methylase UbiE